MGPKEANETKFTRVSSISNKTLGNFFQMRIITNFCRLEFLSSGFKCSVGPNEANETKFGRVSSISNKTVGISFQMRIMTNFAG